MHPIAQAYEAELAEICRRYGVARLELFGSAVTGEFDPASSDLDILVAFRPEAKICAFDNYFGLRESLQTLFGRPVDLVTQGSIRNPYFLRGIEASRQLLYGA